MSIFIDTRSLSKSVVLVNNTQNKTVHDNKLPVTFTEPGQRYFTLDKGVYNSHMRWKMKYTKFRLELNRILRMHSLNYAVSYLFV